MPEKGKGGEEKVKAEGHRRIVEKRMTDFDSLLL